MNSLKERFAVAIAKVGTKVTLRREGDVNTFPASIQPRKAGVEEYSDPLGIGGEDYFSLYAPCGPAADSLRPGDSVEALGQRFAVLKAETFTLGGVSLYRWAALRRETGRGNEDPDEE